MSSSSYTASNTVSYESELSCFRPERTADPNAFAEPQGLKWHILENFVHEPTYLAAKDKVAKGDIGKVSQAPSTLPNFVTFPC